MTGYEELLNLNNTNPNSPNQFIALSDLFKTRDPNRPWLNNGIKSLDLTTSDMAAMTPQPVNALPPLNQPEPEPEQPLQAGLNMLQPKSNMGLANFLLGFGSAKIDPNARGFQNLSTMVSGGAGQYMKHKQDVNNFNAYKPYFEEMGMDTSGLNPAFGGSGFGEISPVKMLEFQTSRNDKMYDRQRQSKLDTVDFTKKLVDINKAQFELDQMIKTAPDEATKKKYEAIKSKLEADKLTISNKYEEQNQKTGIRLKNAQANEAEANASVAPVLAAGKVSEIGYKANEQSQSLRKEFDSDPIIKDTKEINQAHAKLNSVWKNYQLNKGNMKTRAALDQTTITILNKVLDPGSVVREGEYARSEQGQSLFTRLQGYKDSLAVGGAKLDDNARWDIVNTINLLRQGQVSEANKKVQYFTDIANQYGVDPYLVVGGFTGRPQQYNPNPKPQPKPAPRDSIEEIINKGNKKFPVDKKPASNVAPEGTIVKSGNQTLIKRNGKWQPM